MQRNKERKEAPWIHIHQFITAGNKKRSQELRNPSESWHGVARKLEYCFSQNLIIPTRKKINFPEKSKGVFCSVFVNAAQIPSQLKAEWFALTSVGLN